MTKDLLELLAFRAFWVLLAVSNAASFLRAYRMPEAGRERWLRPVFMAVLWLEAVLMVNIWEQTGNMIPVLQLHLADLFMKMRSLDGGMEFLFGLILILLSLSALFFRTCILKNGGRYRWLFLAVVLQTVLLLLNILIRGSFILQSVSIGAVMLLILWVSGWEFLRAREKKTLPQWAFSILSIFLAFWFVIGVFPYLNPCDQKVEFTLLAQLKLPYTLSETQRWEGVYGEYGLFGGPLVYDPDGPAADVPWPEEMNLERYSYIVCYGSEMETLTVNVWETNTVPIRRSSYRGNVTFKKETVPGCIYIYQIDQMRIENGH